MPGGETRIKIGEITQEQLRGEELVNKLDKELNSQDCPEEIKSEYK